jgi:hypothetical protein
MDAAGAQQILSNFQGGGGLIGLLLLLPFAVSGLALWLWGTKVLRASVGLGGLVMGAVLGLGLAQLQGGMTVSIIGGVLGAAAGIAIAVLLFKFTTALLTGAISGFATFCVCVGLLIDLPTLPAMDMSAMPGVASAVPGLDKLESVTKQLNQLDQAKGTLQQLQAAQASGDHEKMLQLATEMQKPVATAKPAETAKPAIQTAQHDEGLLKRIETNIKTTRSGLDVQATTTQNGKRHVVIRSKDEKQSSKSLQITSADETGVPSSMVLDPGSVFAGTSLDMPAFTVPWGRLSVCVVLALAVGIGAMVVCMEYHRKAVCIVSASLGAMLLTTSASAAAAQLGGPSVAWPVWLVCMIALASAGAFVQLRKLPLGDAMKTQSKNSRSRMAASADDLNETRFNPLTRATAAQRSSFAAPLVTPPAAATDSGDSSKAA